MSFDWSHYLVIAEELFVEAVDTAHKEASLRCSISRAYYSAFHHARHKLYDKWNISVSENAFAHAQVQNLFKQRKEKDLAWKLKYMRSARNKVDYDDQLVDLETTAQEVLNLAREVIEALGKL
ncbi:MAG TPA: HEPN domain-containing protein [Ktedonobacteraceae bacterium]|nr:HEPN domain-containing protein [Ktedonobacteraceae bacterium]